MGPTGGAPANPTFRLIDSRVDLNKVSTQLNDTTPVLSVDWGQRTLTDAGNATSVDWGSGGLLSRSLIDSTNIPALLFESRLLISAATNNMSANWDTRHLTDNTTRVSVDWSGRRLVDQGNNDSINYETRTLFDDIQITSANYQSRQLLANDGTTVNLDWSSPSSTAINAVQIFNPPAPTVGQVIVATGPTGAYWQSFVTDNVGGAALDWNDRTLTDAAGHESMDWGVRTLYDRAGHPVVQYGQTTVYLLSDGSNHASVDWGSRALLDPSGLVSADWNTRELGATDTISTDWQNRRLIDSSGISAVDWNARHLLATNGVANLDWSANGGASINGITINGAPLTNGQVPVAQASGNTVNWFYPTPALGNQINGTNTILSASALGQVFTVLTAGSPFTITIPDPVTPVSYVSGSFSFIILSASSGAKVTIHTATSQPVFMGTAIAADSIAIANCAPISLKTNISFDAAGATAMNIGDRVDLISDGTYWFVRATVANHLAFTVT